MTVNAILQNLAVLERVYPVYFEEIGFLRQASNTEDLDVIATNCARMPKRSLGVHLCALMPMVELATPGYSSLVDPRGKDRRLDDLVKLFESFHIRRYHHPIYGQ